MHWKACETKLIPRNPAWTDATRYCNVSSKESATKTFANPCQRCIHMRTIWKTHRLWKKSDLPHRIPAHTWCIQREGPVSTKQSEPSTIAATATKTGSSTSRDACSSKQFGTFAEPSPCSGTGTTSAQRPCFACQQYGHFARYCPNRDGAKVFRQANHQVNQATQPAAPAGMPQPSWSKAVATTVTSTTAELVAFRVNCTQTGHNTSECTAFRSQKSKFMLHGHTTLKLLVLRRIQPRIRTRIPIESSQFLRGRKGYSRQ